MNRLVILIILAAILVPAMIGYVKKAKSVSEYSYDSYSSYDDDEDYS